MKKSALVWIISVLTIMLVVSWLGSFAIPDAPNQNGTGTALIGGKFELVDSQGKAVTEKDFAGKYMLVFFGFTHCPDICPTALLVIQNALNALGRDADQITPMLITIDPERDTPKVMGEYVSHFGSRIVGLTGSGEQIQKVQDAYKVYSSKIETGSPLGHTMDHSSFIYLMGPDGKYITHFPSTIQDQQLKDALAKHLR
jgi:protein SCO1/2